MELGIIFFDDWANSKDARIHSALATAGVSPTNASAVSCRGVMSIVGAPVVLMVVRDGCLNVAHLPFVGCVHSGIEEIVRHQDRLQLSLAHLASEISRREPQLFLPLDEVTVCNVCCDADFCKKTTLIPCNRKVWEKNSTWKERMWQVLRLVVDRRDRKAVMHLTLEVVTRLELLGLGSLRRGLVPEAFDSLWCSPTLLDLSLDKDNPSSHLIDERRDRVRKCVHNREICC